MVAKSKFALKKVQSEKTNLFVMNRMLSAEKVRVIIEFWT